MDEPGCAVIAAVERGKIHPDRYESYVRLRLGQED
jgi:ribosome biogenesis GTPase